MYAKLIVASVIVLALALAGKALLGQRDAAVHPGGKSIQLVPSTLDGSKQLKHWRNELGGSIVEVGALYAAAGFGPAPVLLDFRRGDSHTHNGIGCFLNQGETLDSERLRRLKTANGSAVFDVGILRTPDKVRLIAATECTAQKCIQQKLPFLANFWKEWNLKNLIPREDGGVVPMAIILTRKTGAAAAHATIALLQRELGKVAATVNLAPARRLAAVQSGVVENPKGQLLPTGNAP